MAITGPASYSTTMGEFAAHWRACNSQLGSLPLIVRVPESNTAVTLAQFKDLRTLLEAQRDDLLGCQINQEGARGDINLKKTPLLRQLNWFISTLDGYFQNTDFYEARPYAPSFTDGPEVFLRPLIQARNLWLKINAGPAPAGVTLPLELRAGVTQVSFAAAVAALQAAYEQEQLEGLEVTLARGKRNLTQRKAYSIMKAYREAVPGIMAEFPVCLETMPRLTPVPGHTPAPVAASAVFVAPDAARVEYAASGEAMLKRYELRGCVGADYNEEDAVVIASHGPEEAREFVTTFGLTQPGAEVALKVYVILTTGNEAGSAVMRVERPAIVQALAA